MLALKMLLTIAGALLLLGAVAIPLVGLWRHVQLARKKQAMPSVGSIARIRTPAPTPGFSLETFSMNETP